MEEFKLVIGGELIDGAGTIDVINPATGEAFARCARSDAALLNRAVAAAKSAFPAWSALDIEKRSAKLIELADAMDAEAADFARLLTMEQGKPLEQAAGEIAATTYTIRTFAEMRLPTETLKDDQTGTVVELRTPLGVVAAITPWNFPVLLLINKLAPALLAGNTLVVKPAATTPLTTLRLAKLCARIMPAGVVNTVIDNNDLGSILTEHDDIAKIAFTGSTETGKRVMASAAKSIKRVTLELGGNDAAIILDDVDPKVAARKLYDGAMMNAGQICVAIKRAYVPAAIYDEVCAELALVADAAVVGDGLNQGSEIGPIQNARQYAKVNEFIADARTNGEVIAGGQNADGPGYFIRPTIIKNIADDARIVCEEQFGPVLPVLKYDDIADVLARVNASEYGLSGTVWGKDRARACDVAEKIEVGTVWVNQHLAMDATVPFRGAKQSGLGTELGMEGLKEYTQARIISSVALN